MGFFEICLTGFGLAMDATAVGLSDGMMNCKMRIEKVVFIALCFGIFQGLMPIFGYYFSGTFANFIDPFDNYLVFIIFVFLGIRMIIESLKQEEVKEFLTYKKILIQGVATSSDALMVGLTFAFMKVTIYKASLIIAIITVILTFLGVKLGCRCGRKLKKKAEILGGVVLIVLGIKFLIEGFI